MSAERIQYEFSMQRFEVFKAQDPENGDFDVVFEIQGKKLYAHKSILTLISSTFKSMLSERWTKPNELIKIEGYTFDDFKEFLTFIYSGKCQLTKDNIFSMTDIAEFYGVQVFKTICEEFLTKMELNLENIYQMIGISNKYSLAKLNPLVIDFASKNISTFFKNKQFYELEKCILKKILELSDKTKHQEDVFEAVYQWGEKQAKEAVETDNGLDLNETIKKQISDVLPFIEYGFMGTKFLATVVYRKAFLFTDDELHNILLAHIGNKVQIVDENGKKMKGEIQCNEIKNVVDVIKSQKNVYPSISCGYYYWNTKQSKPSTPSKLIINEKIDWYLVYDSDGDIAIKRRFFLFSTNRSV
uniref:BTB domain-containing protein n=1 Tax=Panagrolaimus davidi TaxID=227884 RepID=A0A914PVG1_9BILA